MEIECGEYVRTKDGIIDQVIIDYKGKCNNSNCNSKHVSCKINYYDEIDIVKHSKQLIDLIECGDYVNGELITDKYDTRISSIRSNFSEKDIKIILTKESYMANCYKVGGEDE